MYRSPPNLRSGSKGQPVPLSTTDKNIPVCPASTFEGLDSISMPSGSGNTDKTTSNKQQLIDPTVVAACVDKHLSTGDALNTLVARLTSELRSVVEEAVKTALMSVNQEVTRLRTEVATLTAAVASLDCRLGERTDELEQYTRRNNLRIFGVSETAGEDTDAIVRELCRNKLGVELREEALCRTHRVGRQPQPGPKGEKRHRPLIVRFISYRDRRMVFGAKKKLKGSGITVCEDLTTRRLQLLKKATEKFGVRRAWTMDGKVFWVDKDGNRGSATTLAELGS